ncbi:CoA ester lyase [Parvibaculum sp.]|uniref:HpcH/HpaI aldolase/citrate lyase family protein n=1 Tax=Parvibaculum sp. TaxID=2024848 RepID=UPI002731BAA1|nr:CoA ester lyase [Parvibaculum sp.]MDP1625492.1 CoA ester lyase [Parvibaculum sp.]MDP2149461.1 CoA ester lyase [Parvibaculum sp.]MDP3328084.1 CoA ester lyase [Parvibaculum sp.]
MADTAARPRRSVLYMPGSNGRALEKAKEIPADALILDLEDAVAPDAKEEARAQVCGAVKLGGYGKREIAIRVNALDTPWGMDDIKAAVAAGPDAILVPKINSAADVERAENALSDAGALGRVQLWCMIETPLALLNIQSIAAKAREPGSRMSVWVMGTNDIAKELRAAHTPDRTPMLASLGLALLAARAYGLVILDGVYNDIKNEEGFAAICEQGRDMGFDGKTLIHPSQVGPCNAIFSPDPETVAFARKTIEAFEQPENRGKGVLKVDGKMVEILHAEIAKRTVAIADAIRELEGAS